MQALPQLRHKFMISAIILRDQHLEKKKKRPPGHTSCDDNTHDQISATSILPDNATYPENKE
jgi:hypothetical protein